MNIFRFFGDMSHLISVLILLLLLKIYATNSRVPEDAGAVRRRFREQVPRPVHGVRVGVQHGDEGGVRLELRRDKDLDTFRHYVLLAACFLLALLVHDRSSFLGIFWAFSIYLEAVAILPQLVLLQRSANVDNLMGQYVFFLGAYRAFYILNWIYRYFTEARFGRLIACISGVVQTALYADFFYYYFLSTKGFTCQLEQCANVQKHLVNPRHTNKLLKFKGWC